MSEAALAASGLALLVAVGAAAVLSGLPVFALLIGAAMIGAGLGLASGVVPLSLYAVLPSRVLALLEHDLLQALPLFVLMGVLLERMRITPALFAVLAALTRSGSRAPLASTILLGALTGPMNGSVSAHVLAMARSAGPRLAGADVPAALRIAIVAVAGSLGIVIPPSLVLILLGDAMMSAHTIAVNATGRMDRIVNTQDVFRGAFPPAVLFVALSLVLALAASRRLARQQHARQAAPPTPPALTVRTVAVALATVIVLGGLLAGVASGRFYAVEAAAAGATGLVALGLATRRLTFASLGPMLSETLAGTGALFAPLVAATTFTLVLRTLGSDRLVVSLLAALPGGDVAAVASVLAIIALSALVLDAFEIIFVVVPIVAPPLLMRVTDATWVAVSILLVLQASFLLPPAGYALLVARKALRQAAPMRALLAALAPFLLAQLAVLLLVLAAPRLVHVADGAPPATATTPPAGAPAATPPDVTLPPPALGAPSLGSGGPSFN